MKPENKKPKIKHCKNRK